MSGKRDIRGEINEYMIDQLEKGEAIWKKSWNTIQVNGLSGNYYRGINQLLLQALKRDKGFVSNQWMTFKQVKDKGGSVKKGSKSSPVVYWNFLEKEVDKGDGTKEKKTIPFIRRYNVFNQDQTTIESEPVHEITSPLAEEIADNFLDGPEIEYGPQPAYSRIKDKVRVPHMDDFVSPEEYHVTKFHELIHATGHKKRLDRFKDDTPIMFGNEDYSFEELVAELGASYLAAFAKIEQPVLENSSAYIRGRLSRLKDNGNMLMRASNKGWQAAEYILQGKKDLLSNLL